VHVPVVKTQQESCAGMGGKEMADATGWRLLQAPSQLGTLLVRGAGATPSVRRDLLSMEGIFSVRRSSLSLAKQSSSSFRNATLGCMYPSMCPSMPRMGLCWQEHALSNRGHCIAAAGY
jgi:hypothetical protein